jgi:hypothetical protein
MVGLLLICSETRDGGRHKSDTLGGKSSAEVRCDQTGHAELAQGRLHWQFPERSCQTLLKGFTFRLTLTVPIVLAPDREGLSCEDGRASSGWCVLLSGFHE